MLLDQPKWHMRFYLIKVQKLLWKVVNISFLVLQEWILIQLFILEFLFLDLLSM